MNKLLKGIQEFRKSNQGDYKKIIDRLEGKQQPHTLFITCSDSRVVPNLFLNAEPGELFVHRNVGNMVPCNSKVGNSSAAAIDFSVMSLLVEHIVICGHSDCGAMKALLNNRQSIKLKNLREWLGHGDATLSSFKSKQTPLNEHDQLSQLNVLKQIEHIKSYPEIAGKISENKLTIHPWWFDLKTAEVHSYDPNENKFSPIDC